MLVKTTDFKVFLKRMVSENIGHFKDIIVPARAPDIQTAETYLVSVKDNREIVLEHYRSIDPVKLIYYHAREYVSNKSYQDEERIIAGIKSCDLQALNLLDTALLKSDFIDPAYKHWREHTTIISADCTDISPNCHCNLLGGKPYPESGFDLNLSKVDDMYFLSVGSEKGETLMELIVKYIPDVITNSETESIIAQNRKSLLNELETQNNKFSHFKDQFSLQNAEPSTWSFESSNCVGCGACTNICPTCYCLILNDESEDKKFAKVRSYDSCQLNGYAKVAGGGTPRPKMHERFRNRYLCKFSYMKQNFDIPGCTGCGRCIDTCPANIDFREVIDNVSNHKQVQAEQISSRSEMEVEA